LAQLSNNAERYRRKGSECEKLALKEPPGASVRQSMLEQFSEQVRQCYQRAVESRARAEATNDPALKADFLNAETRWLNLASYFVFSESLEHFTRENSERRRKFDELLRGKTGLETERVSGTTSATKES
jgi:hypothetical protein